MMRDGLTSASSSGELYALAVAADWRECSGQVTGEIDAIYGLSLDFDTTELKRLQIHNCLGD